MKTPASRQLLLALSVGIALAAGYWFMMGARPLVDEVAYFPQIVRFTKGDFTLSPQLASLPGYTALMALIAYPLGLSSLASLRFLTLLVSACSIAVFHGLGRSVHGDDEPRRTLLFATLPIVAPFYFLLYTDVLSALLVFAAAWCLMRNRPGLSGLLGTASLLVRQNNVVWLAFLMAVVYVEESGLRPSRAGVRAVLGKCWTHLWGVGLFALFVLVNNGVAIGDRAAQPSDHFGTGDLYFLLFLAFFLFLPLHLAHGRAIVRLIRKAPWALALLAVLFVHYLATFKATHPYNLHHMSYVLRNMLLAAITATTPAKAASFLPIAWSLLSLAVTPLKRRSFYLLYPFTALYLIPSWLIEPRYFFAPLGLFIAFREAEGAAAERATIAINLALAVAAVYVTGKRLFFL